MKRTQVGNLLILSSFCLLVYIYFPVLMLFNPVPVTIPKRGDYIFISKINAVAPIINDVDPWNAAVYDVALLKGVAASNTNHNFLFAHSSLNPWEMTRVNTAFLRLGELQKGDVIDINRNNQLTKYLVFDQKEVWPNQIEYINQPPEILILQTCTPLGTSLKRLLVFAKPE